MLTCQVSTQSRDGLSRRHSKCKLITTSVSCSFQCIGRWYHGESFEIQTQPTNIIAAFVDGVGQGISGPIGWGPSGVLDVGVVVVDCRIGIRIFSKDTAHPESCRTRSFGRSAFGSTFTWSIASAIAVLGWTTWQRIRTLTSLILEIDDSEQGKYWNDKNEKLPNNSKILDLHFPSRSDFSVSSLDGWDPRDPLCRAWVRAKKTKRTKVDFSLIMTLADFQLDEIFAGQRSFKAAFGWAKSSTGLRPQIPLRQRRAPFSCGAKHRRKTEEEHLWLSRPRALFRFSMCSKST